MEDIEMEDCTQNNMKEEQNKLNELKKWNHRKKNKYTIEEKLKVLEEIKTNSIHSIEKKYGIDRSSIRNWQKQEDKLKSQTNFKKFRIEGAGAKSELPKEKKDELISWILQNRKLNLSITTSILIKYLLKIYPAFSNKKEHTLKVWCYTFLKNNDFVIRKASHIGNHCQSIMQIK